MAVLIVKWAWIFFASYAVGIAVVHEARSRNVMSGSEPVDPLTGFLFGVVLLTTVAAFVSLLWPLEYVGPVSMLLAALLSVFRAGPSIAREIGRSVHRLRRWPSPLRLLIAICVAGVLHLSAQQSITADDGGYYAPFISWMTRHPIVLGLGNLHDRFAFNSHWHLFAALSSLSLFIGRAANQINGLVYVLGLCTFVDAFIRVRYARERWLAAVLLVCLHLPHPFMVYGIIAPNPDYVIAIIVWVVLYRTHLVLRSARPRRVDVTAWLIAIAPVFLVTVKVSAAASCAVIPLALWVWRSDLTRRHTVAYLVCSLLILIPWLVRNVLLSGHLVYPVGWTAFAVDWSIPSAVADRDANAIREGAFMLYAPGAISTSGMPLAEKYRTWFGHNLRAHEQAIVSLASISLLAHALAWRRIASREPAYLAVVSAAGLAVIAWFLTAPDIRFAMGPLAFCAGLLPGLVRNGRVGARAGLYALIVVVLVTETIGLALYQRLAVKLVGDRARFARAAPTATLLWPTPYPPVAVDTTVPWTGDASLIVQDADHPYLWDLPEPATATHDERLVPRGPRLEDGFKIVPPG